SAGPQLAVLLERLRGRRLDPRQLRHVGRRHHDARPRAGRDPSGGLRDLLREHRGVQHQLERGPGALRSARVRLSRHSRSSSTPKRRISIPGLGLASLALEMCAKLTTPRRPGKSGTSSSTEDLKRTTEPRFCCPLTVRMPGAKPGESVTPHTSGTSSRNPPKTNCVPSVDCRKPTV